MTNGSLSSVQRRVLAFLIERHDAGRSCPTLREIMAAIGARQHSTAKYHVRVLIAKGYVARSGYGDHRALVVLKGPDRP